MGLRETFLPWPAVRQAKGLLGGGDPLGRGAAAKSTRSAHLETRVSTADRVVPSVCPYCAVGCGQLVYVEDEKVTQIEGDPASPDQARPVVPQGLARASSS